MPFSRQFNSACVGAPLEAMVTAPVGRRAGASGARESLEQVSGFDPQLAKMFERFNARPAPCTD
jgi:hypothetical protein